MHTHAIPFKLSALAALTLSLTGCFGGGSNPVQPSSSVTATPVPAAPAASTANGVSISLPLTAKVDKAADKVSDMAPGTLTTDTNATLTTTGSIGRGTAGNVTAATITSTNASHDGGTLTLTHGVDGVTFSNNESNFWGNNGSATGEKDVSARTSMGNSAGVYTTYSYMTFGTWSHDKTSDGSNFNSVTGNFVYGSATEPANIPSSGTATYIGAISGGYIPATADNFHDTYADMSATADFAARSLNFSTSNTKTRMDNSALAHLNMSGTLTYSANSNLFAGSVTDGGGRSGTATGRFYGPAAQEIGGVFGLSGSGTHFGNFAGKK